MTKLTDNIPVHLSNRVNILLSDFNLLSVFQANWSCALLWIAVMFSSGLQNISRIVAFGLPSYIFLYMLYLYLVFFFWEILCPKACTMKSVVYWLHEIQINFYKTNIHFPWFSECHACLYSRMFLCLILSSMRPWNLKSFFFFFLFFFYRSWILFTRVSGMKGSCVVLSLWVLSLKGRKLSHGLSRFCKYRCVFGTLSWIQGCLDFEWQPWKEDFSNCRDLCPKSQQTSMHVHSTHTVCKRWLNMYVCTFK